MNSYQAHNRQYEEKNHIEKERKIHELKTKESLNKSGRDWDNLYKPGHLHGNG